MDDDAVLLRVDDALQVVVDEAALVPEGATAAPQRVLECSERAREADAEGPGAQRSDAPGAGREVGQHQPRPPPAQQAARRNEQDEAEVDDDDRDGEDLIEHEASGSQATVGPLVRRAVGAAIVVGYAWWAVALPPFSGVATVVVLLGGVAAFALGAARRAERRSHPHPPPRTAAWGLLVLAAGSWQLAAYLQHPRADHPTVSSLTNALLDSHPARAGAVVLWLVVAAELARR